VLDPPGAKVPTRVANTRDLVQKLLQFPELGLGLSEGETPCIPDLENAALAGRQLWWSSCAPDQSLAGKPWLTDEDLLRHKGLIREPGPEPASTLNGHAWVYRSLQIKLNLKYPRRSARVRRDW